MLFAQTTPVDSAFSKFMENGPWAALAGFLLWTIIKAWTEDRKRITEAQIADRAEMTRILGEIVPTMTRVDSTLASVNSTFIVLNATVGELTKRIDHIEATHPAGQ